jgi:hypothetical protein
LNHKTYIGTSTDPYKRISGHITGKGSRMIWEDLQKDGREVFVCQVFGSFTTSEEADRTMQTLIMRQNALYPNGYNLTIGGKGSHGSMWNSKQRAKVSGSLNGRSKLTENQVIAIFWDSRPRSVLAKEYAVSTTMITKIKSGQAWKRVTRWLTAE